MRTSIAIVLILFSACLNCPAPPQSFFDESSPRSGALRCEIHVVTNTVFLGERVPIFITVTNVSETDLELPAPGTTEKGMDLSLYLLPQGETGIYQRVIVPYLLFRDSPTADERTNTAQQLILGKHPLPARWITIPAHGKENFEGYAAIVAASEGPWNLQCHIHYRFQTRSDKGAVSFYTTNNLPDNAEELTKAKTSGAFLLDLDKLWTGDLKSNPEKLTVVVRPN